MWNKVIFAVFCINCINISCQMSRKSAAFFVIQLVLKSRLWLSLYFVMCVRHDPTTIVHLNSADSFSIHIGHGHALAAELHDPSKSAQARKNTDCVETEYFEVNRGAKWDFWAVQFLSIIDTLQYLKPWIELAPICQLSSNTKPFCFAASE